jgi:hypothetical protein
MIVPTYASLCEVVGKPYYPHIIFAAHLLLNVVIFANTLVMCCK